MTNLEKTVLSLKANNIQCLTVKEASQIPNLVANILFDNALITAGGSVSLKESGVWDLINQPNYIFLDRSRIGISQQERTKAYKAAIDCDFFFCSCNAITENGELVNVDGNGNRVSSIAFGPKRIIVIAGVNKIVPDINQAFLRIKQIAAPKNCQRLKVDTPCSKLGHCISLEETQNTNITDGCNSEGRICSEYLITAWQRDPNRITVILCEQALGY